VEEDGDDASYHYPFSAQGLEPQWFPAVTEPEKEGLELIASGDFGRIGVKDRAQRKNPNIVKTILNQRFRPIPLQHKEEVHSVRNYISYR
jgi:WD repeat-containing protein 23